MESPATDVESLAHEKRSQSLEAPQPTSTAEPMVKPPDSGTERSEFS